VKCTISFSAGASATSATVRLTRGDRTYARGRSAVRDGRAKVPLRRALPPGRYKLTVQVTDANGSTTASSRQIRVG
jgi:hypothetical protein